MEAIVFHVKGSQICHHGKDFLHKKTAQICQHGKHFTWDWEGLFSTNKEVKSVEMEGNLSHMK